MTDKLLKWLEPPIHILMWVGLLAGFLMMMHVTADVAGRAFFTPITGTNEVVSGYYMIAVAYFPWALIARNDDHIMVELFTRNLSTTVLHWMDVVVKIATAVYVAIFVWQTWERAIQQMGAGEALQVGGGYFIVWPSRYFLPIAGGMMVIYLVIRIIHDIRHPHRPSEHHGESRI